MENRGTVRTEGATTSRAKVAYVYSAEFLAECDRNPRVPSRASMVHTLINAYGLLSLPRVELRTLQIVRSRPASVEQLCEFHSTDYIDCLRQTSGAIDSSTDAGQLDDEIIVDEHGLGYDCPLMVNLFEHVATVAGGTLAAAQRLVDRTHITAVNWAGGWHHGKKNEASGFCYVNDIVLGILKLRTAFDKVLYVDLDVHHGDAVQDAFAFTRKVMTVSFHKFEEGFFPGTGDIDDIGSGRAVYHAVNVPLKDGIRDQQFYSIFESVMNNVRQTFRPNAVVCQCGADCLSGDPMAAFCLTEKGLGRCVGHILDWRIPALFLGGGGYNLANTARCWTYLTSIIVRESISIDIPDNPFFDHYGPGFDLEIAPSNRLNQNDDDYIRDRLRVVHGLQNLKKIS